MFNIAHRNSRCVFFTIASAEAARVPVIECVAAFFAERIEQRIAQLVFPTARDLNQALLERQHINIGTDPGARAHKHP